MDFFICHNEADKAWADWVSWQLEEAKYKVWNPDWDISPGQNEVIAIQHALRDASVEKTERRMILILSPNFASKSIQEVSWTSIWERDPDGSKGLLIPVKVSREIRAGIIPNTIKSIDLYRFTEEQQALECLLNGISARRHKPFKTPPYPGQVRKQKDNAPSYPARETEIQVPASPHKKSDKDNTDPLYKLGQLDRLPQRNHLQESLRRPPTNRGFLDGFIIHGSAQEWPEGIQYRLSYLLKTIKKQFPEPPINLSIDLDITDIKPEEFLWELLGVGLNCDTNENAVRKTLEQSRNSHILKWIVPRDSIKKQEFLVSMLSTWLKLQLQPGSHNHFLLLICKSDYIEKAKFGLSSFTKLWHKTPASWRENTEALLKIRNLENSLLPELESPDLKEHIESWLDSHIKEPSLVDKIKTELEVKFARLTTVPLYDLKKALEPIIKNHYSP